eukprot:SAG11_NODE_1033_length_6095_cov_5.337725_3_plen_190_part_00
MADLNFGQLHVALTCACSCGRTLHVGLVIGAGVGGRAQVFARQGVGANEINLVLKDVVVLCISLFVLRTKADLRTFELRRLPYLLLCLHLLLNVLEAPVQRPTTQWFVNSPPNRESRVRTRHVANSLRLLPPITILDVSLIVHLGVRIGHVVATLRKLRLDVLAVHRDLVQLLLHLALRDLALGEVDVA